MAGGTARERLNGEQEQEHESEHEGTAAFLRFPDRGALPAFLHTLGRRCTREARELRPAVMLASA
jgi:hypothetical protein